MDKSTLILGSTVQSNNIFSEDKTLKIAHVMP